MNQQEIQDRLCSLFEQLVPAEGKCNTTAGEIVRACNRILYRRYNDGDIVGSGYGNITVNPACRFLEDQCRRFHVQCEIFDLLPGSHNRTYMSEEKYDVALFGDMEKILKMLDEHPGLFTEENLEDMLNYLENIDEEEDRRDSGYYDDDDDEEY